MDKAQILNKQFQSVFSKEIDNNMPEIKGESFPTMPEFTITRPGIEKLLAKIKPEKAASPDQIHLRAMKELATPISYILKVIFTRSLDTAELPVDWKLADVTPIYKKGEKFKASNYWPVSLTCISCKIMEHITSNMRTTTTYCINGRMASGKTCPQRPNW